MKNGTPAPCGSWKSPITAAQIAQSKISFQEIQIDGEDIYWIESRPTEAGRNVLMRAGAGRAGHEEVTPPGYNVSTLMYSYGGGAFTVCGGTVFFSNSSRPEKGVQPYAKYRDQRLFRHEPGHEPSALTDTLNSTYADGVLNKDRTRLITVREDGSYALHGQAAVAIVAIDLSAASAAQTILVQGADFYTSPRLSPDGSQLCWLSWNYPSMPWDGTQLWLADVTPEGALRNMRMVAGGTEESIVQPEWSPDGVLYFISDRTNWWNLYRYRSGSVEPAYLKAVDFAAAPWTMRAPQYAFLSEGEILCTYVEDGSWKLAVLDIPAGELHVVSTEFTEINHICAGKGFAAFIASASDKPAAVVRFDTATRTSKILKSAAQFDMAAISPYFSQPEPIRFATGGGKLSAFAFYYPPVNPGFSVPHGEKPPLIIRSHGGPTSAASTGLDLAIQYFTSRGFAVVDVNYRGSTGYGREFRLALYGNWGLHDMEDCERAADYLVANGSVDPARIVARGGSSGGYTTLCLLTYTSRLRAGASYYGISDLEKIVFNSDKLEAHYPDKLVGPYPQDTEKYRARSPVFHAEKVRSPAIFFQGLEDPVVPPEQTRDMVEQLKKRRIPVAALYFEHESHGFRIAENIRKALEAELYFYSRVLSFTPADALPPIDIDGLP